MQRLGQLTAEDLCLAQFLHRMYTDQKKRWCGDAYRKVAQSQFQFFKRAAIRFRELRQRGYPADPVRFVRVVFSYFGARTYPAHFVSDVVWNMYFRTESTRGNKVKEKVQFEDELDMLNHLLTLREQSLVDAWPGLKKAGVFSEEFGAFIDDLLKT